MLLKIKYKYNKLSLNNKINEYKNKKKWHIKLIF